MVRFEDVDECASNNGGCSNGCINIPSSYQCTCPDGYALMEDRRSCQDVDECHQQPDSSALCGNGGTCQNTDGSYQCLCPPGYRVQDGNCLG